MLHSHRLSAVFASSTHLKRTRFELVKAPVPTGGRERAAAQGRDLEFQRRSNGQATASPAAVNGIGFEKK